jgi:hypothetical protein
MMKRRARRALLYAALLLALAGCSAQRSAAPTASVGDASTSAAQLKIPTREILVTDGDLNKPYEILGSVEYKLTGQSLYSTQTSLDGSPASEVAKEAKEMLRRVAYTKYGDRVDAIINTKVVGGYEGGFAGAFAGVYGGKTGVVQAEGIAVSFKK